MSHGLKKRIILMFDQTVWFLRTGCSLRITPFLLKKTWSTCDELKHM